MLESFSDKVIIKRTKRKKTISISIKEGNVIVLSPRLISKRYLKSILEKKKKGIIQKLEEESFNSNIKKRIFLDGEIFFKFGKEKMLVYKKSSLNRVIETNNLIKVYCFSEKDIKKQLESWYKEDLNFYLKKKLEVLKTLMKVDYKEFSIKLYKSRLGSCSYAGNLAFNWKIAMMPYDIINYIIVHELSHLKYFDHSKSFWNYVEKFCPDYKEKKIWIKKNKNLILW